MSFAELQEEIFTKAKQAAQTLRSKQQQSLRDEEARVQKQARAIEENIIDQAKKEGRARAQRIHQSAQLEAKAAILQAKQAALKEIQQAVAQSVLKWEAKETEDLISTLLKLIPDNSGVITPGEKHAVVVKKLAGNREVSSETIAMEGGFIWRGEKNELKATVTYMVEDLFSRRRAEMAKVLF